MNALHEYLKLVYGALTAANWRDPSVAKMRLSFLWEEFVQMIREAWK